jgi:hypothetical protein
MSDAPPVLRMMTRLRANLVSRGSVWFGAGQIVLVEWTMTSETFKRFLVEDTLAVVAWPSVRREVVRWVLGSLTLVLAIVLAVAADSIALGLAALAFGAVLVGVNELRGPTVCVELITPVQRVRLWPMGRRREWDRFAAALRAAHPVARVEDRGAGP